MVKTSTSIVMILQSPDSLKKSKRLLFLSWRPLVTGCYMGICPMMTSSGTSWLLRCPVSSAQNQVLFLPQVLRSFDWCEKCERLGLVEVCFLMVVVVNFDLQEKEKTNNRWLLILLCSKSCPIPLFFPTHSFVMYMYFIYWCICNLFVGLLSRFC